MTLKTPLALTQLYDQNVHYMANLWKMERSDGEFLYLTDHPSVIPFEGDDYTPVGGSSQTATQNRDSLKETNKSLSGAVLDVDSITFDDLRAGLYRNTKVTEYKVDWRVPWMGYFFKNVYYMADIKYNGSVWEIELNGVTSKLRKPIGRILSANCDWVLGENHGTTKPGCQIDLSLMKVSGSVVAANVSDKFIKTDVLSIKDHEGVAKFNEDNWFKYGRFVFTSGNNTNIVREVLKSYVDEGKFVFTLNYPFDIQVGDTFDVYPGCNKSIGQCISKFDNVLNFGGNPSIPGTDALIRTPDAK